MDIGNLYAEWGTITEWRVIYFPPEKTYVVKTGSEDEVRAIARRQSEWNPIVESRMVHRELWEAR